MKSVLITVLLISVTAIADRCKSELSLLGSASKISISEISRILEFNIDVIKRLQKKRPELFAKMKQAVLSGRQKSIDKFKAVELHRGEWSSPRDYDPTYNKNRFFTSGSENWFSFDSSKAHNYASPNPWSEYRTRSEAVQDGHKYYGVIIHIQVPQLFLGEHYHQRHNDISFLRKTLGDESDFISSISVDFANVRTKQIEEKRFSYESFRAMFFKR